MVNLKDKARDDRYFVDDANVMTTFVSGFDNNVGTVNKLSTFERH